MNEQPYGAVVLLSGGLDSATLLAKALDLHSNVHALSIFYGQRHDREIVAAGQLAEHYGISEKWEVLQLHDHITRRIFKGSSQTDESVEVPEGHYTDETMKLTVVPNRNMLFISLATAYAMSHNLEVVGIATHAGDHHIYPDCRPRFNERMNSAIMAAADPFGRHILWAPFQYVSKSEIVKEGLRLGVPYDLTWTCYKGQEIPCGKCGSCVERAEAFADNNTVDPLLNGRR